SVNRGPVNVGGVAASNGIDWDGLDYRGTTLYGYMGSRDGNTGLADSLFTMDVTTGTVTSVGPTGVVLGPAGGITYDADQDIFFLMSRATDVLYSVNPLT
ncbi:MAG: hypothetical protein O3B86_10295, partial [Planctomycetota bacterium]|nr:hypothetical protein [Planctomycetota bacterium]